MQLHRFHLKYNTELTDHYATVYAHNRKKHAHAYPTV